MRNEGLTNDPLDHLGVYKSFADVPNEYRLENFEGSVRDDPLWVLAFDQMGRMSVDSKRAKRARRRWNEWMDDQNRHYALADPIHIEGWFEMLTQRCSIETAYSEYFVYVDGLYSWLAYDIEFPHRYNPVLLAVAAYPISREIWDVRVEMREAEQEKRGEIA